MRIAALLLSWAVSAVAVILVGIWLDRIGFPPPRRFGWPFWKVTGVLILIVFVVNQMVQLMLKGFIG